MRIHALDLRAWSHPVERQLAQVPDPGRELQAEQVEQPEIDQGHSMRVGRVLGDRQVRGIAQDLVEHEVRFPFRGDDDLRAVGRVLIRHVRVRTEPFLREVPAESSRGQRLSLGREALASEEDRVPPPKIGASGSLR